MTAPATAHPFIERTVAEPQRRLPPGPRLPRAVQAARMGLRPLEFLEACRRRFGDTFTVRALSMGDIVFISDPRSLRQLLAADRVHAPSRERRIVVPPVFGSRSLFVLDGEDHYRWRRLVLPPFHGERMRAHQRVIEEATLRELERWPAGVPFALYPSMRRLTFEVIMRTIYGAEGPRRQELHRRFSELGALGQGLSLLDLVRASLRRRVVGRLPRPVEELLERIDALLFAEIAERRADPQLGAREDILSMLIAARFDDGSAMDDADLRDQLITLVMTGHDPIAIALAWAFDLLLHAPEKGERLRAELAVGDQGGYLDAVVKETLRVRTLEPLMGRTLREPIELDGWKLAPGTYVAASIHLIHTRPDLYPEPYEFKPERFLDAKPGTYTWVPFGGGVRRCIGAAFAPFEMRTVLRTVLANVRLEPASPLPERPVRRSANLVPRNGTLAVVAERL